MNDLITLESTPGWRADYISSKICLSLSTLLLLEYVILLTDKMLLVLNRAVLRDSSSVTHFSTSLYSKVE